MNPYNVVKACVNAVARAKEEGKTPLCFFITPEMEEALRTHPMILLDYGTGPITQLLGADVEIREDTLIPPRLMTDPPRNYFLDEALLGGEDPAPGVSPGDPFDEDPPRLRFDIRVVGEYLPDPAAFGSVKDPVQWAESDAVAIRANLPQFFEVLGSLSPDARVKVTVEPVSPGGVDRCWNTLASGGLPTPEAVVEAMIALCEAYRQESHKADWQPDGGREFSLAITELESAAWRIGRGLQMLGQR